MRIRVDTSFFSESTPEAFKEEQSFFPGGFKVELSLFSESTPGGFKVELSFLILIRVVV
jgi:hypothetical protein